MDTFEPILYISMRTGMEIHEHFQARERWQLETGKILKSSAQGRDYKYYRIVGVEDDEVNTKVYLKPIPIHFSQVFKLILIAALGWFVFNAWWKMLIG